MGRLGSITFVLAVYQIVRKPPHVDCPLKLAVASQLVVDDNETVGADGITTNFNRITPDSLSTHDATPPN